jgi:hypothetical protein
MGRQANFWALPEDIEDLLVPIKGLHAVEVVHSRSPSAKPRIVGTLNFVENQHRWLDYFLVRREDLPQVAMEHISAQGYWVVDYVRSPVVEFSSCFFNERVLRRGRVYYNEGYDEGSEWRLKPEAFRAWAARVVAKTRKQLMRHGTNFLGKRAAVWMKEKGGKLEG